MNPQELLQKIQAKPEMMKRSFIIGFAVWTVLFFIPYSRYPTLYWYFQSPMFAVDSFSLFGLARVYIQTAHVGWFLLVLLVFAARVAFLVLSITKPKRWVFISGACWAALAFTIAVFSGRNTSGGNGTPIFFVLVEFAIAVMCFAGFFVKPSTKV